MAHIFICLFLFSQLRLQHIFVSTIVLQKWALASLLVWPVFVSPTKAPMIPARLKGYSLVWRRELSLEVETRTDLLAHSLSTDPPHLFQLWCKVSSQRLHSIALACRVLNVSLSCWGNTVKSLKAGARGACMSRENVQSTFTCVLNVCLFLWTCFTFLKYSVLWTPVTRQYIYECPCPSTLSMARQNSKHEKHMVRFHHLVQDRQTVY